MAEAGWSGCGDSCIVHDEGTIGVSCSIAGECLCGGLIVTVGGLHKEQMVGAVCLLLSSFVFFLTQEKVMEIFKHLGER